MLKVHSIELYPEKQTPGLELLELRKWKGLASVWILLSQTCPLV